MTTALPPPPRALPAVRAIVRVVVLEAVRGRVAWLMLAMLVAGIALAGILSAIAITESDQVAAGVLGAWLRLASVFVTALFVATSMMRDWSDKGMELVIAQALPRRVYLSGRLLGYAAVALACAAVSTLVLLWFVPAAAALAWGGTLAGELLIVAAMALLCMLTFNQMPLALSAVAGFYLLARAMDSIVLMASNPLSGSGDAQGLITGVLEGIAFVLPDLGRFARSDWLIGGGAAPGELLVVLVQTAIYLVLLFGAALFDLERKVL